MAASEVIFGYGGADWLVAGGGVDQIYGGSEDDFIELDAAGNDTFFGDVVGESFFSGNGNDSLDGGAGNDVLNGGGADRLLGSLGVDVLTGGVGRDAYVLTQVSHASASGGADVIKGFQQGVDRIDLSAIDAKPRGLLNGAFKFPGDQVFSGRAGEVRFTVDGRVTTVEGDTTGDGAADFALALTGAYAMTAGDFVL